jgi:hypothetical protein
MCMMQSQGASECYHCLIHIADHCTHTSMCANSKGNSSSRAPVVKVLDKALVLADCWSTGVQESGFLAWHVLAELSTLL